MPQPFLQVRNVYFTYPDGTNALENVHLSIDAGEIVAVIGENGSGKTTLAKLFNGLLKPTKGKVAVDGVSTTEQTIAQLARKVGYVFQNPSHQIFSLTVLEEAAFGLRTTGCPEPEIRDRTLAALDDVGLKSKAGETPFFLSKGEKQRLAIASILGMRPKALVLDEPTTGQDWTNIETVMRLVTDFNSKYNQSVIVITHNMHVVAYWARRAVVMSKGRIIYDGPTRGLFSQVDVLSEAFIAPTQVARLANDLGINTNPLTVNELARDLLKDHHAVA